MSRRDRRRASHGGSGRDGDSVGAGGGYDDARGGGHRQGLLWSILGIVAELLLTMAAVCALYVVWQMWWTGVQSEHAQVEMRQSVNWTSPGSGSTDAVAPAQEGDPPVQPESAAEGELIATVYIPRFGDQWERNLVQGTSLVQLNKHGLGHYTESQWPGQVGNFAIAGHRNGYGQPLGDVDKLQPGDVIVVRTQDYWYVYEYTSSEIVLPDDIRVIGSNPLNPGAEPTERMITMTTCEPKYSTPTHRWISYGKLKYWAKVADGWPQELATSDAKGGVTFTNNATEAVSPVARLDSLAPVVAVALVAYAIVFVAALVAWRFPLLRAIRAGERRRPDASLYGWLMRHQPGVLPIRLLLVLLLLFAAAAALFEWGFPWAASNIPYLQQMSNFTAG
ncbi:class E sortase [Bifidobacterium samirii]